MSTIRADYIIVETYITITLLSHLIHQPVFATSHNIFSSACLFLFSDGYDTPCCKDCLYTNTTGTKCRDADPTNCQDNTYCDGKSPRCPSAPSMRDGTRCIDRLVRRALCLMYSFMIWQGIVKHVPPVVGGGGVWKGLGCSLYTDTGFFPGQWLQIKPIRLFRATPRFFFFRDFIWIARQASSPISCGNPRLCNHMTILILFSWLMTDRRQVRFEKDSCVSLGISDKVSYYYTVLETYYGLQL